jgi:plastocyanin
MDTVQIDTTKNTPTTPARRGMWLAISGAIVVSIVTGVVLWKMGDKPTTNRPAAEISIGQQGINPATIKIERGQSVTITNRDNKPHKLAADTEQLPGFQNDEPLQQSDSYTYTPDAKGTFHYYDAADAAHYTGTIIVE